jgi:hypothetical protein
VVPIPKIIGVVSCGVFLCLGLPNASLAINNLANESEAETKSGTQGPGAKDEEALKIHIIKGEVFHVAPDNYLVKEPDGKLVRLHIDSTTQMTGNVSLGERIEVKVNDNNHALSIRQAQ